MIERLFGQMTHNYPQDSNKDAARYLSKVRKIASNRR
jgi:hypothetical protein